jgi:SNF2 family DNA or RNA helicase
LQSKHTLVITGTPIENRLIDLFSIVSVLDPYFFGPLWEFSYQHCLFDPEKVNKINGYYNLQALNGKLADILIRREKRNVLDQMPNVQQIDIPVALSPEQAEYHASYAKGIAAIIRKKYLTAYDLQRLQLLLANMRMVCDSTYLIDEETNVSPKLEELENILFEQFDLKNTDRKVIIFSEWIKVHKLIGQLLRQNKIGFVELNGKVPVKARGDMIRKFENSPECKVFLSTEAGGAGLNLQIANTLINFELPWNPAKKNQRIGRIDRLGQKSNKLTIYNLITRDSIEQQIAAGLLVKQNLFESVLDGGSTTDYVDFSSKGRSQFIDQLEAFINLSKDEGDAEDISGAAPEETIEHEDDLAEALEPAYAAEDAGADKPQASEKDASEKQKSPADESESKATELEQVMDSGMQFLAGLFKMSTGKDLGLENRKITVNKETGEVTMSFKLPMSV